jgi:hypothetical protein
MFAGAVSAQMGDYAGPAVISRGAGGGAAPAAGIGFRPFFNVSATYTGTPTPLGNASDSYGGGEAAVGLYGYHGWKNTELGVNYRGDYRHYTRSGSNDGTTQLLTLGLTHRFRHVEVSAREAAGSFTQNMGYVGTFGFFDPVFAQVPYNEVLDRRTNYISTMLDVTYQKSRRLSFNFGGTGFTVRRQSNSLYSVTGASARADAIYRISRRTSIGADYFYTHYGYNRAFGAADLHSVGVDYSVQLSHWWSVAMRGGVIRTETLALQTVNIDPAVAAILGQNVGLRAFYALNSVGTWSGQILRRFQKASASASYTHGAAPGNGIYLTSAQDTFSGQYSYSGFHHWSLEAGMYAASMRSLGQDIGRYNTLGVNAGLTRALGSRNLYFTLRGGDREYKVGTAFSHNYYTVSMGLAYSPGDLPLRLW